MHAYQLMFFMAALAGSLQAADSYDCANIARRLCCMRLDRNSDASPIVAHTALTKAAKLHNDDMAKTELLTDIGPGNSDPYSRAKSYGLDTDLIYEANFGLNRVSEDFLVSLFNKNATHRSFLHNSDMRYVACQYQLSATRGLHFITIDFAGAPRSGSGPQGTCDCSKP